MGQEREELDFRVKKFRNRCYFGFKCPKDRAMVYMVRIMDVWYKIVV